MQIELVGDWSENEAVAIARQLQSLNLQNLQMQKSLGMESSGLDDLTPPTIAGDIPALLSKRQKKLLEQWHKAGRMALECEPGEPCADAPDWEEYSLKKAFVGALKTDKDGDRFRFNSNRRWEKISGEVPEIPQVALGKLQFSVSEGEFGDGVYFPVVDAPSGFLRLRLRLDITPDQLIDDGQFYELEDDLSVDLDFLLDSQQIKAVLKREGDRVIELMVRSPGDIEPLGVIAGSGEVPKGAHEFRVVKLEVADDHLTIDVEMAEQGAPLTKAADARRVTMSSKTHLDGTKLIRTSAPDLDRSLVRQAIARCQADGVPVVKVVVVSGVPDFLPKMVHAYCLPSDGVVNLCPHDPQSAIASLCGELAERLQAAVRAGAVPGDVALDVLARAAKLSPQWWLEMLVKRYSGAVLCAQVSDVMTSDSAWTGYINLLAGRGVAKWGNRRAISECMAEDFRVAFDPAGLPNLVTLEWDLAVPALARMGQQLLLKVLNNAATQNQAKHIPEAETDSEQ